MSDIQTFLADLALDSKKFAEFLREPEAAMDRERLSDEDKAALLSGIPAMIAARLAAYLSYPPPYYSSLLGLIRPTYVTLAPEAYVTVPPPVYVTAPPPVYVTAPPPLYVTAPPPLFVTTSHPVFVTMPPPLVVPATPREGDTPRPPKTPPRRSR